MEKEKLFSAAHLKCQCILEDGIEVLSQHLTRSRTLLDDNKSHGLIKSMQNSLNELKRQSNEHMQFRIDYARELIDLVKARELNVGPSQKRLRTVPYLSGQELDQKKMEMEESKGKRKKKRKNKV